MACQRLALHSFEPIWQLTLKRFAWGIAKCVKFTCWSQQLPCSCKTFSFGFIYCMSGFFPRSHPPKFETPTTWTSTVIPENLKPVNSKYGKVSKPQTPILTIWEGLKKSLGDSWKQPYTAGIPIRVVNVNISIYIHIYIIVPEPTHILTPHTCEQMRLHNIASICNFYVHILSGFSFCSALQPVECLDCIFYPANFQSRISHQTIVFWKNVLSAVFIHEHFTSEIFIGFKFWFVRIWRQKLFWIPVSLDFFKPKFKSALFCWFHVFIFGNFTAQVYIKVCTIFFANIYQIKFFPTNLQVYQLYFFFFRFFLQVFSNFYFFLCNFWWKKLGRIRGVSGAYQGRIRAKTENFHFFLWIWNFWVLSCSCLFFFFASFLITFHFFLWIWNFWVLSCSCLFFFFASFLITFHFFLWIWNFWVLSCSCLFFFFASFLITFHFFLWIWNFWVLSCSCLFFFSPHSWLRALE